MHLQEEMKPQIIY